MGTYAAGLLKPGYGPGAVGALITPIQRQWNKAMSSARVSVEWIFGDIINYYKFLDFKKNLKIGLSAVGKMYIVCALMHNTRCCLNKSNTTVKGSKLTHQI